MQFMTDSEYYNIYKYDTWDCERKDEYEEVKRKISSILIEQKISLSEARFLLNDILDNIERKNPITKI